MNESKNVLNALIGREVVLDLASPFVYLGTLVDADESYLVLENADAHDLRDTTTSRERYVVDSHRHGLRANRRRVLVRRDEAIGISALEDVLD